MKTFRFLTLAVIALLAGGFLQSCSDDDDGPGDNGIESLLVGAWESDINSIVLEFTADKTWNAYMDQTKYEDGDAASTGCSYRWIESSEKLILYSKDQINIMAGVIGGDYEPELILVSKDRDTIVWRYKMDTSEWDITWTRID